MGVLVGIEELPSRAEECGKGGVLSGEWDRTALKEKELIAE